MPFNKQVIKKG